MTKPTAATLITDAFEDALCQALTRLRDEYAGDPLTPGLLLSRLHGGGYYVAVHRFPHKGRRQVLMNGRGATLLRAIERLAPCSSRMGVGRKVEPIR